MLVCAEAHPEAWLFKNLMPANISANESLIFNVSEHLSHNSHKFWAL